MSVIAKRNRSQNDVCVAGILHAHICKQIGMDALHALIFAQILYACINGAYKSRIYNECKYFYLDLDHIAKSNLLEARNFRRFFINPWCDIYEDSWGRSVVNMAKPLLMKKRFHRHYWYSYNSEMLHELVIPSRHKSTEEKRGIDMLFDLSDYTHLEKQKPKEIESKLPRKLGKAAPEIVQVYEYARTKENPYTGKLLFNHPKENSKLLERAFDLIRCLRDGTFLREATLSESFWATCPQRWVGNIQVDIKELKTVSADVFVERVTKAIDHFCEAFDPGKEPLGDKKYLSKRMPDYFFNPSTNWSDFLRFYRFEPETVREAIADKIFETLPMGIQNIGSAIFDEIKGSSNRSSLDSKRYWYNIKQLYQRAFAVQRMFPSDINYWYETPKKMIASFYEWMTETMEWNPKTLTDGHFSLKGRTFEMYLDWVQKTYHDVTEEIKAAFFE